ncbi:MAG TPA: hypothetical protein VIF09_06455 [Polyangiaceae bacterium]|jgi:hypothetical protein
MRRFFSLSLPCLALALVAAHASGCGGSNNVINGNDGGTGGGDDGGSGSSTPHALGTIVLAESHAPSGGGTSSPLVLASFLPDAAGAPQSCSSKVAGCDFVSAPQCGLNGGLCGAGSTCAWDSSCHPTCKATCTLQCGAGQECYFPSPNQPACRSTETFDAGAIAFAGTTTPITLFPPYSYEGTTGGAPFLAGSQIEVQGSGATGAGFDKFDEKFTATTFLQTNPALDKIPVATVFGAGTVPIGWAPGNDSVKITVSGAGGVATCTADDTTGHFEVPRAVITSALGQLGTSNVIIGVTRERDEWKKSESTHGSLTTAKVQPVGWLELTTASSESHTFQGCATAGQTMCPDGCFDTSYDQYHCGSCTTVCSSTQSCQSGQCTGGTTNTCTTCESTADTGTCYSYYSTCMGDSQCSSYQSCSTGCGAGNTTCLQGCQSSYPSGYSEYTNYKNCVCFTACPSECSTQCAQ